MIKGRVFDNIPDVSYLDKDMSQNDLLIVKDASFYENISQKDLAVWCHFRGIYNLPTTELIEWLKGQIIPGETIEIGAGVGTTGRALNIPITDSCIMEEPLVALHYKMMRQPTTKYPIDIVRLSAQEAILHYKPSVVIGCWVTQIFREEDGSDQDSSVFGIDEDFILEHVEKYIVIGNKKTHGSKRIMGIEHKEYQFPWLYSRSMGYEDNVIYVWEK